ncbi:MAG: hypothetical protein CSA33_05345 [Desulfobulbus propionicus]|nr:MAG: hypothetical protein CSA33_05345 [Desulfobulbus propionicus]
MAWGGTTCDRQIIHFNVADFAVAVERLCDLTLREKPVIIAPMGFPRTVVYDMSEEAYGEGVRKGMPLQTATRLCPAAKIVSPRIPLYQKAMGLFGSELQLYSPLIESGQVDGHFYVDLTGTHRLHGPAHDVAWRVRKEVQNRMGIDPIWTLASNKLVSKVASRLVKPIGEYIISPGEEPSFLAPLAIRLLPGLKRAELERLQHFQLTTFGSVAALSREQLMIPFGQRSQFLHDASRGVDNTPVWPSSRKRSAIVLEEVFAEDTNDSRKILAVLSLLASQAGERLRNRQQVTRRLGVWLSYADGTDVVRQASHKKGVCGEDSLQEMLAAAFCRAWFRRTRVRSCRLVCDRLSPCSPQGVLFPEMMGGAKEKNKKLDQAMDTLRSRHGSGIIGRGRCYPVQESTLRMAHQLSPDFSSVQTVPGSGGLGTSVYLERCGAKIPSKMVADGISPGAHFAKI